MKILLTGASGFLGRALVSVVRHVGEAVPLGCRQTPPGGRSIDLRDSVALASLMDEVRPDVVINSAAYREPDVCERDPVEARRLNVAPLAVLLRQLGDRARLIQISTDYVFRGDAPPYAETSKRAPVNVYGQTKMEAEDLVLADPRGVVLRVPVLVGAGVSLAESGFLGQMMMAAQAREVQWLDDVHVRVPTWIEDVARGVELLLRHEEARGIFHLAGPDAGTRYALTRQVAVVLSLGTDHLRPDPNPAPRGAPRPCDSRLATARLEALGWTGGTSLDDVVRSVALTLSGLG